MLGDEFVDNFGKELMCHERRVVVVGNDDPANAFCAPVGMERVVCKLSDGSSWPARNGGWRTLLFHILPLPWASPFCHSLAE